MERAWLPFGWCVPNAYLLHAEHPDRIRVGRGYARHRDGSWYPHWWGMDDERAVDPTWQNDGLGYVVLELVDLDA